MRVVVIGGSYAGIAATRALEASGIDVTLIERNEWFFHKIGGTRACVKPGYETEALLPLTRAVKRPASRLVHGAALNVNAAENKVEVELANGEHETIEYDHLILAMGLSHGFGQLPEKVMSKAEMLEYLRAEQERVRAANVVVIVGGGALGVETSTQIKATHPDKEVHLYHSKKTFLSAATPPVADEFSDAVHEKLEQMDIVMHLGGGRRTREDLEKEHPGALVIFTAGCAASASTLQMLPEEWLSSSGEVKVLPTLQVDGAPSNVYAVGDLAASGDFKQARCTKDHAKVVVSNINGKRTVYNPSRSNPWFACLVPYLCSSYVRARTSSTTQVSLYIGETDGITQGFGLVFSDKLAAKANHSDKGVSKAKKYLGLGDV
ncbi:Apoptosis-inducing factor 2 [Hondaea fermentalgiana]|uniref:Apoptosis-inducing factor 2 n=1 Tax=Hondaea fermentalgiana TaxID=2315210 RepID=A0A2R5G0P4_9STRA|nr:Apoptosis-inducing factor 2 [Hondaea fermentalgiana]|eukprot:GBG23859.1 Apoptosis-inducing factor 2 [Hondaea fermentalgiana]